MTFFCFKQKDILSEKYSSKWLNTSAFPIVAANTYIAYTTQAVYGKVCVSKNHLFFFKLNNCVLKLQAYSSLYDTKGALVIH